MELLNELFVGAKAVPSTKTLVLTKALVLIDRWANEVLMIRADTYKPNYDPFEPTVVLDDLFGSYLARESIARIEGLSELLVVRALDSLLISITEESGRQWLEATGMEDRAGDGWWWSRLPVPSSRQAHPTESRSEG